MDIIKALNTSQPPSDLVRLLDDLEKLVQANYNLGVSPRVVYEALMATVYTVNHDIAYEDMSKEGGHDQT